MILTGVVGNARGVLAGWRVHDDATGRGATRIEPTSRLLRVAVTPVAPPFAAVAEAAVAGERAVRLEVVTLAGLAGVAHDELRARLEARLEPHLVVGVAVGVPWVVAALGWR